MNIKLSPDNIPIRGIKISLGIGCFTSNTLVIESVYSSYRANVASFTFIREDSNQLFEQQIVGPNQRVPFCAKKKG